MSNQTTTQELSKNKKSKDRNRDYYLRNKEKLTATTIPVVSFSIV